MNSWKRYEPSIETPWNLQRVVHLHRRAGFAANWSEIQRDLKDSPQAAIDRLLDGNTTENAGGSDSMVEMIGDAAVASGNPNRLKAWWLHRMVTTTDSLGERLSLMWHNYFATSNRKVNNLNLMREQNELFREFGRGRFADLLASVVKHPAMMIWLDADSNRKGNANENLAREMLELFTVGRDNFNERDVKETARALTGWTVINDRFENRMMRHDDRELSILGANQPFNGDELLDLLLKQSATAKRVAERICKTFMGENVVDEASLQQLADGLSAKDLDIGWAVETVLRSELFFSDANIRSKVVGPVELMVGAIRSLELNRSPPSSMILAEWIARMGQDLFYPPNVGGWKEGRSWLSTRTLIARVNFVDAMAKGELWHPATLPKLDQLAQSHGVGDGLRPQIDWLGKLFWGEIPPAATNAIDDAAAHQESLDFSTAAQILLSSLDYQLA